jgi:hypothetical protein
LAIMHKKGWKGGAHVMAESPLQSRPLPVECPECGAKARLYRTPRGLRCAECVKRMDSAGLGFR